MNILSLKKRCKAALKMTLGLVLSASVVSFGLAFTSPAKALEPYEYANPSAMTTEALLLDAVQTGNRLVAVGEYGHVILSDDQGESWQQANSVPTRNTLTSVMFLDNQTGYAVGHEATILKTSDGGNNWDLQFNERRGETPLFGVYFSDRSEEHTSELQSQSTISYAVFCLKKKKQIMWEIVSVNLTTNRRDSW